MKTEKPSLTEIVKETGKEIGLPIIGKALAKGTGHVFDSLSFWYTLPTMKRRLLDQYGDDYMMHEDYTPGELGIKGVFGSVFLTPVIASGLNEDWNYLLIPVATNLISWMYENYRRVKNTEEWKK